MRPGLETRRRRNMVVGLAPFDGVPLTDDDFEQGFAFVQSIQDAGHVRSVLRARKWESGRFVAVNWRKQVSPPAWRIPRVIVLAGWNGITLIVGWRMTAYKLIFAWRLRRRATS